MASNSAEDLPHFSGCHGQDIKTWLGCYSEAIGLEKNDKKYEMISLYIDGEVKEWLESNKEKFKDWKEIESALMEKYGRAEQQAKEMTPKERYFDLLRNDFYISEEGDLMIQNFLRTMRITFPATFVRIIKENPPEPEISDASFKLCVVAACTNKRDALM